MTFFFYQFLVFCRSSYYCTAL